jgi:hypothetical protein
VSARDSPGTHPSERASELARSSTCFKCMEVNRRLTSERFDPIYSGAAKEAVIGINPKRSTSGEGTKQPPQH